MEYQTNILPDLSRSRSMIRVGQMQVGNFSPPICRRGRHVQPLRARQGLIRRREAIGEIVAPRQTFPEPGEAPSLGMFAVSSLSLSVCVSFS